LENWSKQTVREFHQEYEGNYAGDISSPEIFRLSKKYIKGEILDIGAGSGALLELLPNAIGLDLVSKHPRMFIGDISNMPFKDKSFDTMFATEIFEHLDSRTLIQGLAEIKRVLKENGKIIVTVPYNEDFKQNVILCPKCHAEFHRWGHTRIFTKEQAGNLLLENGFKIIKIMVIPLGFVSKHKSLRHLILMFNKIGYFASGNIFLIGEKV
jgi:SAM-dependent methyltransferase